MKTSSFHFCQRRACGFSLIEVVLTVFVIGTAFVLYHGAVQNVFVSRSATYRESALRIALGKLDELRKAGYAALPPSGAFADAGLADIPGGSGSVAVSDFNAGLKQVDVTVSWSEPNAGTNRSVLLSTLIIEDGGI